MSDLRALAEAEPSHDPRLNKLRLLKEIQLLIDRQMADLTWQKQYVTKSKTFRFFTTGMTFDTRIYNHLAYGKRTMDEIRANLNSMQNEEEQLLTERVQEINAIWLLFWRYLSDWQHASLLGIFLTRERQSCQRRIEINETSMPWAC
jgi:hypothetical protein